MSIRSAAVHDQLHTRSTARTVSFIWMLLILMRTILALKPELKLNVSVLATVLL